MSGIPLDRLAPPPGLGAVGGRLAHAPQASRAWAYYFLFVAASAIVAFLASPEGTSFEEQILGIALWALCCLPSAIYGRANGQGIPGFELLCIMCGLQFALPVFVLKDGKNQAYAMGLVSISPEDMSAALGLSILGMGGMLCGYYGVKRWVSRRVLPVLGLHLDRGRAFAYAVIMSFVATLLNIALTTELIPAATVGPVMAILSLIILQIIVAIPILVWLTYDPEYAAQARVALIYVMVASVGMGMVRGELERMLLPVAALIAARWHHTRKVPWRMGLIGLVIFAFFQPAKDAYRIKTWSVVGGDASMGIPERVALWFDLSAEFWSASLAGGDTSLRDAIAPPFQRLDLVHQFGHIYSMTPHSVPYRYGKTYSYMFVSWIPRAFWPDKPFAQQVNKDFAVDYGIQTERGTELTMFGISVMIEGFINFGAPGVALAMGLTGVLLGVLDRMMNQPGAGIGSQCIYLSVVVQFLNGMASSTCGLYGNLVQVIACSYVVIAWTKERRRDHVVAAGPARLG